MKFFIISIFSLLSTLPLLEVNHDFHISRCEINYNKEAASIEISINFFIDDLETALSSQGIDSLYIGTKKESAAADTYIYQYLQEALKIQLDEKAQAYIFIGKEQSEDLQAIWCYLEIKTPQQIGEITVEDSVLLDIFDDQVNVVNITQNGKVQDYFLFNIGYHSDTVKFK